MRHVAPVASWGRLPTCDGWKTGSIVSAADGVRTTQTARKVGPFNSLEKSIRGRLGKTRDLGAGECN